MPEYLAPGVYVEEVSSGIKPIEGVSTSTVGFVGRTERGPREVQFIDSFSEYQRVYGDFLEDVDDGYLPYAVKGFFDNGGKRAYVARVVATEPVAKEKDKRAGIFTFKAKGSGRWGSRVYVLLLPSPRKEPGASPTYDVWIAYYKTDQLNFVNPLTPSRDLPEGTLRTPPNRLESFTGLANIKEIVTVVNSQSRLVEVEAPTEGSTIPTIPPQDAKDFATGWTRLAYPGTQEKLDASKPLLKNSDNLLKELEKAVEIIKSAQEKASKPGLTPNSAPDTSGFPDNVKAIADDLITKAKDVLNAFTPVRDFLAYPPQKDELIADSLLEQARIAATAASRTAIANGAAATATAQTAAESAKLLRKNWDETEKILAKVADALNGVSNKDAELDTAIRALDDDKKKGAEKLRKYTTIPLLLAAKEAAQIAAAVESSMKALVDNCTPALIDTPAENTANFEKTLADQDGGSDTKEYKAAIIRLEDIDDISILVAPEYLTISTDPAALEGALVNSCEILRDRVTLLCSKSTDTGVLPTTTTTSTYAAFYHPWITVANPLVRGQSDTRIAIPPVGHIAGIIARTDILRGVHKAPANEIVLGALDLKTTVSKGHQDILNPRGVNCIRDFTAHRNGIRLWGARTVSSDPEWKYLNVRRLFLFLEKSIERGTQWIVFEPNSDPTWAAVRRNLTNFLTSVWRSGALMGLTQEQAFYLKCDRTTMTEDDINNGRLICEIGVAPVRPAEFVIFRISQKTLDAQA